MPARNTKRGDAPKLCTRRAASGNEVCYAKFNGRIVSFGPAGPEAKQRYAEHLARWEANDRQRENASPTDADRVDDLIVDFLDHAEAFYAVEGQAGGEYFNLRAALAPVNELFGALPAAEFGPLALRTVRDHMVEGEKLCRREINSRVHRIRRAWRWAASMQKVPAGVVEALATVDGLRMGKTTARESEPVLPVSEREVRAVVDHLCPTVAAMVWFQWWTGCRPGEACALRWSMIDRAGPVWIAALPKHKTAWRGRIRQIAIGPKAQEHLRPIMVLDPAAFVFSPQRALAEQRSEKSARRRSKLTPSQRRRAELARERPREEIAEAFTCHTLRRAIARAVQAANAVLIRQHLVATIAELRGRDVAAAAAPAISRLSIERCATERGQLRLGIEQLQHLLSGVDVDVAEVLEVLKQLELFHPWGPNRLRHSAATRLRREEGLEAARVVLGHARAAVTEIYAEADHERSREIMKRLG